MKNTLRKSIAAVLVLVALTPVRAPAAATVYAEESPGDSVVAPSETEADTNAPSTKAPGTNTALPETTTIRIDKTGIHIDKEHSGDTNAPSLALHHKAKGTDWEDIVAIVFGCGVPVAIVGLVLYFGHRRNRLVHETVRAMIEKGQPVTPELVAGLGAKDGKAVRPRSDLRKGLIVTGVGIGLVILVGKPGWIVLFIGVAFLVVWLVEPKNQNGAQPPR
jgi:hypothetical protein